VLAPTPDAANEFFENVADGVVAFLAVMFFIGVVFAVLALIRYAIRKIFRRRKHKWKR
jgi:succinate dehydrogenase/fumarate reductase cytochrome b subunit